MRGVEARSKSSSGTFAAETDPDGAIARGLNLLLSLPLMGVLTHYSPGRTTSNTRSRSTTPSLVENAKRPTDPLVFAPYFLRN